jgi:signal transduction histidine kinase
MKAFLSISVQILLAVLITVISVLGVSGVIELSLLKQRETKALQDKGALTADRIANSLAYPVWNLNKEETERVVLYEMGSADTYRILVFDENNALYVGKERGADGVIKDTGATNAGAIALRSTSASLYSLTRAVDFKNTRIGRVTLDVTDASLQAELRELRRGIVIKLVLLALLLSIVLFVALRVLVIRPVSTLQSWVENLRAMPMTDLPAPRFKSSGEINALAEAFDSMSLNLRRKNEELEGKHTHLQELNQQLQAEIVERRQAEAALRTSTEQLRALSARLQSAREEEGTRIAREIHDEMGSALTSLKWDLEKIGQDLSRSNDGSAIGEARERINLMTGLVESTINTVRRISSELRPGVLDDLGLVAAIEWQAQQFQSRTGIRHHADTAPDTTELERESATAVFRIFQEILTNVLRHSQAANIYVKLRKTETQLQLEVSDDGRGITESEKGNTRSLGLVGMRERALLVGGNVEIVGVSGKGTTVSVSVPLDV